MLTIFFDLAELYPGYHFPILIKTKKHIYINYKLIKL